MNEKLTGALVLGLIIGISAGYFLFHKIDNTNLKYSSDGFPKNCRAIIKENIDSFNNKEFSAEDALDSIDRNCGEFGYSW